ncbi:MAG: type II toxin-antitoxin system HicB family antitoxin [Sphaerobacter sp.]|nr:type II toxin-antitoxin system HicB family antitoxin [Sphaerobacter sp.]
MPDSQQPQAGVTTRGGSALYDLWRRARMQRLSLQTRRDVAVEQNEESMQLRQFPVVLEWDAENKVWVTYVPQLGISDFGETREEAIANTREAIQGYLEAAAKEGIPIPPVGGVELVRIEVALSWPGSPV